MPGPAQNKKISVAIATYNGERYLAELIESIRSQTVAPFEIVCADDASTDGTVALLHELSESSSIPIKVIERGSNVGIIQNFLSSFENCTGDYIAYCDQDDVWLEDRLAQFQGVISDDAVHLVCSPSLICDGELRESGLTYYDINQDKRLPFPAIFNGMHAWGHQMLFSKAALNNLILMYKKPEFEFSEFGNCFDFTIPFAASLTGDLFFQKTPKLKFRRHAASTSEAGHNLTGKQNSVRDKAVARRRQVEAHSVMLKEALDAIDWLARRNGKDFPDARQAYQQELDHIDCRLKILEKHTLHARLMGIFSKTYIGSVRHNRNGRTAIREALIDTIAAIAL